MRGWARTTAAFGVLHVLLRACGSEQAPACCGHSHVVPPPQPGDTQEHKVLHVTASETTSLRLKLPVTLRGAASEECPTPTLRGTSDSESTLSIEGRPGGKFGVETLKLTHPGAPANETIPIGANESALIGLASGTCCIGIDGGKVGAPHPLPYPAGSRPACSHQSPPDTRDLAKGGTPHWIGQVVRMMHPAH